MSKLFVSLFITSLQMICLYSILHCSDQNENVLNTHKVVLFGNKIINIEDYKKGGDLPCETLIYYMKKDLEKCFAKHQTQLLQTENIQLNDLYFNHKKHKFIVNDRRNVKSNAKKFKTPDDSFVMVNFKNPNLPKVNCYRLIYIVLTIKLINFIDYMDSYIEIIKRELPWIINPWFYHNIYDYIETNECPYHSLNYIREQVTLNSIEHVFEMNCLDNYGHGFFKTEKSIIVLSKFINHMFIRSFKEATSDTFESEIIFNLINARSISDFKYENTDLLSFDNLQAKNDINDRDYEPKNINILRAANHLKKDIYNIINVVLNYKTMAPVNESLNIFIDINDFYIMFVNINMFLLDSETNILYKIKKNFDIFLALLFRISIGSISFAFNNESFHKNLEEIKKWLNAESIENFKQEQKIGVKILFDSCVDLQDVFDCFCSSTERISIFLKDTNHLVILDLVKTFHELTLYSLIYFFKKQYPGLFVFSGVIEYEFIMQTTRFKSNSSNLKKDVLNVDLIMLYRLLYKISTLVIEFENRYYQTCEHYMLIQKCDLSCYNSLDKINTRIDSLYYSLLVKYCNQTYSQKYIKRKHARLLKFKIQEAFFSIINAEKGNRYNANLIHGNLDNLSFELNTEPGFLQNNIQSEVENDLVGNTCLLNSNATAQATTIDNNQCASTSVLYPREMINAKTYDNTNPLASHIFNPCYLNYSNCYLDRSMQLMPNYVRNIQNDNIIDQGMKLYQIGDYIHNIDTYSNYINTANPDGLYTNETNNLSKNHTFKNNLQEDTILNTTLIDFKESCILSLCPHAPAYNFLYTTTEFGVTCHLICLCVVKKHFS